MLNKAYLPASEESTRASFLAGWALSQPSVRPAQDQSLNYNFAFRTWATIVSPIRLVWQEDGAGQPGRSVDDVQRSAIVLEDGSRHSHDGRVGSMVDFFLDTFYIPLRPSHHSTFRHDRA